MDINTLKIGHYITDMVEDLRKDYPIEFPNCKFRVGDVVKYIGNNNIYTEEQRKRSYIVSSIAQEDDNLFEITLSGFPYLVWDNEIELIGVNNHG
jgi:hypothetical protein